MTTQFKAITLLILILPATTHAQLRPDGYLPSNQQNLAKYQKMLEARDAISFGTSVSGLKGTADELDRILAVARELHEAENDSSPGKRYGLLIEGFELLQKKIGLVEFFAQREEYSLAAETIDEIELMNRLWNGSPNEGLKNWADSLRLQANDRMLPVQELSEELSRLWLAKQLPEARAVLLQILSKQREIYGDNHSEVLDTLIALWEIHMESELVAESKNYLAEALKISTGLLGDKHWKTIDVKQDLKATTQLMEIDPRMQKRIFYLYTKGLNLSGVTAENVDRMLAVADREIGVAEKTLGFESSLIAASYVRFARLAARFDRLNYAVAFYLRGALIAQKIYGDENPLTASAIMDWSQICRRLHDDERAFDLAVQAVHINRRLYGEWSSAYMNSLELTATLYFEADRYPQARTVLEKVKRLRTLSGGEQDVAFANTQNNLSKVYLKLDELELAQQELEAVVARLPGDDRLQIEALEGLASVWLARGDVQKAVQLQAQATNLAKEHYEPDDIRYAYALENLAAFHEILGELDEAGNLLSNSLAIERAHLDRLGKLQGTRLRINAYLKESRGLSHYLTIASELGGMGESAYELVTAWKAGAIRQGRVLAQNNETESELIFDRKLQSIADQISNYVTVVDTRSDDSIDIQQLNEVIQGWEDCHRNMIFSQELEYGGESIELIKQSVPANTVLVDFFQYEHTTPKKGAPNDMFEMEARVLAFVILPDGPVEMLSLGTVDEIEGLVYSWREEIERLAVARQRPIDSQANADLQFSELIWKPIAEKIGNVEHIIICPDGMLCLVPWSALPVDKQRRYVIEDASISLMPHVGLLTKQSGSSRESMVPAMTLVGNLDYSEPMDESAAGRVFSQLPGTAREAAVIKTLFDETFPGGQLSNLQRKNGTELNVRLRLMQSNYLHVATHGFFAPDIWQTQKVSNERAAIRARVREMTPEVLSALVFSGANRGLSSADAMAAKSFGLDGILTGLEVSSMDLRDLELVTLSACQTSLGTVAPGVGKLGLELSFLTAGAQSVVSSLWQVDDAATAILMAEFYTNLWSKKMSKSEAIRQAQLTLLHQYDRQTNTLKPRGLKLVNEPDSQPADGRLPPYFWAPFILSGDWK